MLVQMYVSSCCLQLFFVSFSRIILCLVLNREISFVIWFIRRHYPSAKTTTIVEASVDVSVLSFLITLTSTFVCDLIQYLSFNVFSLDSLSMHLRCEIFNPKFSENEYAHLLRSHFGAFRFLTYCHFPSMSFFYACLLTVALTQF